MKTTRSVQSFQRTFQQAFRAHHAPFRISSEPSVRSSSIPTLRRNLLIRQTTNRRHQSTESVSHRPLTDRKSSSPPSEENLTSTADEIALRKALSPAYQLWFTCKKCLERSGHTVSKQAYHFGTCVINCPKCKSQHLISDNLKIFSDTNRTMEDIAKEYGEKLKKGRLGADGDIEFYDEEAEQKIQEGIDNKVESAMRASKG